MDKCGRRVRKHRNGQAKVLSMSVDEIVKFIGTNGTSEAKVKLGELKKPAKRSELCGVLASFREGRVLMGEPNVPNAPMPEIIAIKPRTSPVKAAPMPVRRVPSAKLMNLGRPRANNKTARVNPVRKAAKVGGGIRKNKARVGAMAQNIYNKMNRSRNSFNYNVYMNRARAIARKRLNNLRKAGLNNNNNAPVRLVPRVQKARVVVPIRPAPPVKVVAIRGEINEHRYEVKGNNKYIQGRKAMLYTRPQLNAFLRRVGGSPTGLKSKKNVVQAIFNKRRNQVKKFRTAAVMRMNANKIVRNAMNARTRMNKMMYNRNMAVFEARRKRENNMRKAQKKVGVPLGPMRPAGVVVIGREPRKTKTLLRNILTKIG